MTDRKLKRKCQTCNRTKTVRNFSYRKRTCNLCYKESDVYARTRDTYLRKAYGITLAEYLRLLDAQGGGCAICGGKSGGKNLAVDHDHKTGKVRGLLCKRCNSAIARWVRSAAEARVMAMYLTDNYVVVEHTLGRSPVVVPQQEG